MVYFGDVRLPSLTRYLQEEFPKYIPPSWVCTSESHFLSTDLEEYLGFKPRADILLETTNPSRRIWVEFEISRADPVANHTKFATAHLFQPQGEQDIFVSMVSSHVAAGRRNLAESTILLMRSIGMDAFHLILLPMYSANEIYGLNRSPIEKLRQTRINIESEITRITNVIEPVFLDDLSNRIHFVGDLTEVKRNVNRWNQDIRLEACKELWGKRTITYFVYDSKTLSFAPSKFCAYIPVLSGKNKLQLTRLTKPEMSIEIYQGIERNEKIFDGKKARDHLNRCLCMNYKTSLEDARITFEFEDWLARNSDTIRVHPSGPIFLVFPQWF
jgi:hypothetical protein